MIGASARPIPRTKASWLHTAAALVVGVGACSSHVATLEYAPSAGTIAAGKPAVSQVLAIDKRGEADPTWIGAIRGGMGQPLKTLYLSKPLDQTVADVFRGGLAARGWLAAPGSHACAMTITISRFSVEQMVRSEADIAIAMDITRAGAPIYQDRESDNPAVGSLVTLKTGIFADPADLNRVGQTALVGMVDKMLDKPALRAALLGC